MIAWRKSSRSGTNDDSACVEVAAPCGCGDRVVGVRDSKDPDGPKLWLPTTAWAAFVADIKSGSL
ncbi:DUF397 domain-containing protein [Actinomadura scrupuli]|uniref:DUF397 domain-containing protein n=1 Tax=Actinomadura scrupuli TaxID=559629 RepID=UPI003D963A8F